MSEVKVVPGAADSASKTSAAEEIVDAFAALGIDRGDAKTYIKAETVVLGGMKQADKSDSKSEADHGDSKADKGDSKDGADHGDSKADHGDSKSKADKGDGKADATDLTEIKVEKEFTVSGLLFRINPRECDYTSLDVNGDIFCTRAVNLISANVREGTLVFMLASGPDRRKGILGIWRVVGDPWRAPDVEYNLPIPQARPHRMIKQWRMRARLIVDVQELCGDNLDDIFMHTSVREMRIRMIPQTLTSDQTHELLQAYGAEL